MAEFRLPDNQALWLSQLPEATYNTSPTTAADYVLVVGKNLPAPILPEMDKITNDGELGRGHTYKTKVCNDYYGHTGAVLGGDIGSRDMSGRMLLRGLGGTVTSTVLTTPATAHRCNPLPMPTPLTPSAGNQLPGTSMISMAAAASFLISGMVVEEFGMSQERAQPVQYTCQLVGTGKHVSPNGVASLTLTEPDMPCMDGGRSEFIWTNSTPAVVNWHTLQRVLAWSVKYKNNHVLNDRRIGNALTGVALGQARHVSGIPRGAMTVEASVTLAMDHADINEFTAMCKNEQFTDVTFGALGATVITGTIYDADRLIIPKARISKVAAVSVEGIAAVNCTLEAYYDSTVGGLIKGEVVNNHTTVAPNNYR